MPISLALSVLCGVRRILHCRRRCRRRGSGDKRHRAHHHIDHHIEAEEQSHEIIQAYPDEASHNSLTKEDGL